MLRLSFFLSYARGEENQASDIDLLILLQQHKVDRNYQKRIKHPLYDIEFDTGIIVSPLVLSQDDWHLRHHITPFYENIQREGKRL